MSILAPLILFVAGAAKAPNAKEFAAAYFLACPVKAQLGEALERIEPGSAARFAQKSEFDREWTESMRERAFALLSSDARAALPPGRQFEVDVPGKLGDYDAKRHGFPVRLFWPGSVASFRCFGLKKPFRLYGLRECEGSLGRGEFMVFRGDEDDVFWPVDEASARAIASQANFAPSAGGAAPIRLIGLRVAYELTGCRSEMNQNRLRAVPVAYEAHHARTPDMVYHAALYGPALGRFDAEPAEGP
jgi:hypothetical protein